MTLINSSFTWLRSPLLKAVILVVAVALIYTPVYHGEFLWDDHILVTDNWMVQSGSLGGLAAIWVEPDGPDYFPLTYTALWLEWQAFGDDPTGYHLVNIALHAISGLLLWRLLAELRLPGAWLAALLFAVHPVCVESVAWISEIKNTLSLPFFLLACLWWVRQDEAGSGSTQKRWYAASLTAFVLALLAKPSMVGMPLLTLLYAWWKRQQISRQDLLRMVPLFLIAITMGLITIWYQRERAIAGEVLPIGGLLARVATAGMAVVFYLAATVWPIGLMPIYPRWLSEQVALWHLLPLVGLTLVVLLMWQNRHGWGRHALLAGGFFTLMVAPVLGLVPMSFMRVSWVSDHFLYLPMIGLIGGFVGCVTAVLQNKSVGLQIVGRGCLCVVGLLLAVMSQKQATHWGSSKALWAYAVDMNDQAWQAYVWLGDAQLRKNEVGAALKLYERAIDIYPALEQSPQYPATMVEVFLKQGEYARAIGVLEKMMQDDSFGGPTTGTVRQEQAKMAALQKSERLAKSLIAAGEKEEGLIDFYNHVGLMNRKMTEARRK
jgi:hypothetical protein